MKSLLIVLAFFAGMLVMAMTVTSCSSAYHECASYGKNFNSSSMKKKSVTYSHCKNRVAYRN